MDFNLIVPKIIPRSQPYSQCFEIRIFNLKFYSVQINSIHYEGIYSISIFGFLWIWMKLQIENPYFETL